MTEQMTNLVAAMRPLNEAQLCALLRQLPARLLKILGNVFDLADCKCKPVWKKTCYCEEACDCPKHLIPCTHVLKRTDWSLPPAAHALLIRLLHPQEFTERALGPTASRDFLRNGKLGTLMARARQGLAIHRPDDVKQEDYNDVAQPVSRKHHGSGWGRLNIGDPVAEHVEEIDFLEYFCTHCRIVHAHGDKLYQEHLVWQTENGDPDELAADAFARRHAHAEHR